jgi:hypothetical protein
VGQTTAAFASFTAIFRLIFVDFCANHFVCFHKKLIKENKRLSAFPPKTAPETDLSSSSLRSLRLCWGNSFAFG